MKKIKVYIQYPWKVSDSQYYKSLVDFPPEKIEFLKSEVKRGIIVDKKKIFLANFIKENIRKIFQKTNFPVINKRLTKIEEDFDIIHCAHCLSNNLDKPWVADFESMWQMWIIGSGTKNKKGVLKILQRKNCKKILAWTEETKKDIIKKFPEIKNKVEVVSFAMESKKIDRKETKDVTLLFSSRYFYQKGGVHALEAFDILTKKYKNVKAIFISPTPEKFKEKYKQNKKILFSDLMPHDQLVKEIFPKVDIFVYPGYSDTFGFLFVEAMAFGIPVITVDGFARGELVEDEKTGLIIKRSKELKEIMSQVKTFFEFVGRDKERDSIKKVHEELINKIVRETEILIKNKNLRRAMSKFGMQIVREGKFSIKERNKKLRKVYTEAID
jgi:glycosyltransferase involved in cell wall biosynthesis